MKLSKKITRFNDFCDRIFKSKDVRNNLSNEDKRRLYSINNLVKKENYN